MIKVQNKMWQIIKYPLQPAPAESMANEVIPRLWSAVKENSIDAGASTVC
jgi:hypothetical protein